MDYNIKIWMMPGSKGLSPHELAHRWVKDLRTRPDMSIKVGGFCPDIYIILINCVNMKKIAKKMVKKC